MDETDRLIDEILDTLKSELPAKYRKAISEFEGLTNKDLLRASYNVIDELCRKKDFHPSTKLLGLRDRYKIVF